MSGWQVIRSTRLLLAYCSTTMSNMLLLHPPVEIRPASLISLLDILPEKIDNFRRGL